MEQFKIEIAKDGLGYYYDIKTLGNRQYEIYNQETKVGTIEIDGNDHEKCKTINCELDLPLLNAIREAIVMHQELRH
ncbi:hypothetical protein [Pedobacter sp.]|uniref:hypothetical protein n=1 Tax=Pedobacter sp. TaxID=1411316 RepID=UPI003D7F2537